MQIISNRTIHALLLIVGLLGLLSIYYFFNPTEHSFLPCPFKFATGYHCPGCGSQRAIHHLTHGNIAGAFSYNPLMVLSLPLIFYGLGTKLYNYIYRQSHRVTLFYSKVFIYGYFGIAIVYWIVRNFSMYPFNLLAPPETI